MSKLTIVIVMILAVLAEGAKAGAAQGVASDSKVSEEILNELKQIRMLLENQSRPAAPPQGPAPTKTLRQDVGDAPYVGAKDAPLTIVEFTDFQCPFCQRFHQQTFPLIKKNYIDTGKVRFFSINLPLEIHQNALIAAEAGQCANDQGKFWPMRDRMQSNPSKLYLSDLMQYAQDLGINVDVFRDCVESEKYKARIVKEAADATANGAVGTPAFIVGKSTTIGVEGELIVGALGYGVFEDKLNAIK